MLNYTFGIFSLKIEFEKMKRYLFVIGSIFILQSCIVSTAANVVKTAANITYGAVKGTVKGVSWAFSKASGKIDEDDLNGTWKLVGIYNGTYDDYVKDKNAITSFNSECLNEDMYFVFKTNKSKFQSLHCSNEKENWTKYKFKYGKNPVTKEKENYLTYNSKSYISIIDVNKKTLVMEGNLLNTASYSGNKLYLFQKK